MKLRSCWIGFTAVICALPLAWAEKPGEAVADLVLRDPSGAQVKLSTYRQQKNVALLALAPGATLAPAVVEDACRRLASLDTVVLFLASDGKANRQLLENASSATLLIDSDGVLRRMLPGRVLTGADLAGFVKLWLTGRTVFKTACARCHGDEGDSTICWDVKSLVGIGRRLSETEVRARLRPAVLDGRTVLIRSQFFTPHEVDAVIVYVAGL